MIDASEAPRIPENGGRTPTGCEDEVTTKVTTSGSRDVPRGVGEWFEADTGGWPTLIVLLTLMAFIAAVVWS